MKKKTVLLFTLLLSSICFSQSLDNIFGNSGIVTTANTSEITELEILSDGKILTAGYYITPGSSGEYHLQLVKYKIDGTIDLSFGTNGFVNTPVDFSETPNDLIIQPDNKIIVAGSYYTGPNTSGPGDYFSFLVRYNTDGSLDGSFGNNGIARIDYVNGVLTESISSCILLPNGQILVGTVGQGGFDLVQLNTDGSVDTSFGNNGISISFFSGLSGALEDLIRLADGTLICSGRVGSPFVNAQFAIAKFNADGSLFTGFADNGQLILDIQNSQGSFEAAKKVIVQPDGYILIGGYSVNAAIIRLKPTGILDSTFANNGVLLDIVTPHFSFSDFILQPDGKILVGGSTEIGVYNTGYSLLMIESDGTIDNSFGTNGRYNVDLNNSADYAQAIKLQNDGKILLAGSSKEYGANATFGLVRIHTGILGNSDFDVKQQFKIYPNPLSAVANITSNEKIKTIQLHNLNGQLIKAIQINDFSKEIDMSELSNGLYVYSLQLENGVSYQGKIIKQ